MHTLAFLNSLSPTTMLLLLVAGLLVFGRKLPEVGRSLGKGIVEFKKGLKGIDDDIEAGSNGRAHVNNQIAEQPYRAPLSHGQDVRVSRNDPADPVIDEPANRPSGQAG